VDLPLPSVGGLALDLVRQKQEVVRLLPNRLLSPEALADAELAEELKLSEPRLLLDLPDGGFFQRFPHFDAPLGQDVLVVALVADQRDQDPTVVDSSDDAAGARAVLHVGRLAVIPIGGGGHG